MPTAKKKAPKTKRGSGAKTMRKMKLVARPKKPNSKAKARTAAPKAKRATAPKKAAAPPKRAAAPTKKKGSKLKTTPPHPELSQIPQYHERPDEAFNLETSEGTDALAEELGEEFIENVTGADDAASEHRDEASIEESGGPFVTTSGSTELADDYDESNPPDALREPLPRVSAAGPK